MNKADLIEALAPRLGGRAQAALAVEAFVDLVLRQVASGGSVGVTGFGVFERVDRAARTGRNPRTGEAVPIAATSTPRFRPATYFKDVVNDPSQLPTDGLAGVRVGTHEEDERVGAPASVRRAATQGASGTAATAGSAAKAGSATRTASGTRGATGTRAGATQAAEGAAEGAAEKAPGRARRATSGRPATVRKTAPKDEPQGEGAEVTKTPEPARGGRMMIGGEDITRSMISAKKAQLAKVKNDQVVAKEEKAKKSDDKKSGKKAGKKSKSSEPKKDKKTGKKKSKK